MSSLRRHEGYVEIDHRDSPGVPESLIQEAAKAGKIVPHVKAGEHFESATVTCSHCHTTLILNPNRTRSRGYCPSCDHYVCDGCEAVRLVKGCVPMNKVLDGLQNAAATARNGIVLVNV